MAGLFPELEDAAAKKRERRKKMEMKCKRALEYFMKKLPQKELGVLCRNFDPYILRAIRKELKQLVCAKYGSDFYEQRIK